jgi:hypothetical protein
MIGTVSASSDDATGVSRAEWIALAILVASALALRLRYLGQPMRNDEAYSYLYFALPSLRTAVSDYTVPNNHVFHTVLVWAATRLFGNSPEVIRLPALIAGVLCVPATWMVARALAGPDAPGRGAGLLAAAAVAVLPALLLYSTNARAYMLICLATLLLVWIGERLLQAESLALWAAVIVVGALGMWAAPVMLYPLGAVSLWLMLEHARTDGARGALRFVPRIAAAAAAVLALAALLYLPVLLRSGPAVLTGNRFVEPLTWSGLVAQRAPFARALRELLGLGLSRLELLGALLVALLGVLAPAEGRARRATLAIATAAWCGVLILATRRPPPARVLLFLAPLWCVYVGIGLSWLVSRIRVPRAPVHALGAVLLFALLAVQAVRSRAVLESEETDWIGMRDARALAALIASGRAGDRIVINRSSSPPLDYYLYRLTGRRLADFANAERRTRVLLVLDDRHGQTLQRVMPLHREVEWTSLGPPTLLRRFPGASVYAFATRVP